MLLQNETNVRTSNATAAVTKGPGENGDMFPPDLEFIDDADVVTLPDGTVKLVTDKPKTGPSSVAPSQVSRDTSKMAPAGSIPPVGVEAKNATDNSTAEIIKMLRRRQAPVPAPVIQQFTLSPVLLQPLPIIPSNPFQVLSFAFLIVYGS